MTSQEKINRDMDTLRDSIKFEWQDLASKQLTIDERNGLKQRIDWFINELKILNARLEAEA